MQSALQEEKAAALAAVLLIISTRFSRACASISAASESLSDCLKKVLSQVEVKIALPLRGIDLSCHMRHLSSSHRRLLYTEGLTSTQH